MRLCYHSKYSHPRYFRETTGRPITVSRNKEELVLLSNANLSLDSYCLGSFPMLSFIHLFHLRRTFVLMWINWFWNKQVICLMDSLFKFRKFVLVITLLVLMVAKKDMYPTTCRAIWVNWIKVCVALIK